LSVDLDATNPDVLLSNGATMYEKTHEPLPT
jgi:hypothetical protein